MIARKAILLITLVFPGLAVVRVSLYWFNLDYAALIKAEKYVENLVEVGKVNDRQLEYAYHRTYIHRINVFADGTWGLLGGVIAALGIHGLVTIRDFPEINYSNKLTTETRQRGLGGFPHQRLPRREHREKRNREGCCLSFGIFFI